MLDIMFGSIGTSLLFYSSVDYHVNKVIRGIVFIVL